MRPDGSKVGTHDSSQPPGIPFVRTGDTGLSRGFAYTLSLFFCRIMCITWFDIRIVHVERIPKKGATILAANHQSFVDPVVVGMSSDRASCYLAKQELFRMPIFGWLVRLYNTFPVPRESLAPKRAIEICRQILDRGRSLVMFPEGTRSADGRLQPVRRGISLIAKMTRATVVPALVTGTYKSWPRSAWWPRPGRASVTFGTPIRYSDEESLDSFTDRLSSSLRALAVEAGAEEMIGDEIGKGDGSRDTKEVSPSPGTSGKCDAFPQPAGDSSFVSCAAK